MSVLETLIVASCVGLSGNQQDACNKALVAGAKQSGVEAVANTTENNVTKKIDKSARSVLGGTSVDVVAGSAFIAKTAMDKSATINLPNFGVCDSLAANVSQQKTLMSIKWSY